MNSSNKCVHIVGFRITALSDADVISGNPQYQQNLNKMQSTLQSYNIMGIIFAVLFILVWVMAFVLNEFHVTTFGTTMALVITGPYIFIMPIIKMQVMGMQCHQFNVEDTEGYQWVLRQEGVWFPRLFLDVHLPNGKQV